MMANKAKETKKLLEELQVIQDNLQKKEDPPHIKEQKARI